MMHTERFGSDSTFETLLDSLRRALSVLAAHGYAVNPSSRFCQIQRQMENAIRVRDCGGSPSNIEWDVLYEGLGDIYELTSITSLPYILTSCSREVQTVLSGAVIPYGDSHPHARNLQFQLFVTATLGLLGWSVTVAEPDIRFDYEGQTYCVAAKRVSVLSQIETRISEGRKQVAKAGIPGFIALGLEQVIRRKSNIVVAAHPDALWEPAETLGNQLLEEVLRPAVLKNFDPMVVGYFVSMSIPAILPHLMSVGFSRMFRSIAVAPPTSPYHAVSMEIAQQVYPPIL